MSRFYVSQIAYTDYLQGVLVCDKEDYIVEYLHLDDARRVVESGIAIDGVPSGSVKLSDIIVKPLDEDFYKRVRSLDIKRGLAGVQLGAGATKTVAEFDVVIPEDVEIGYTFKGITHYSARRLHYTLSLVPRMDNSPSLRLGCVVLDKNNSFVRSTNVSSASSTFPIVDEFRYRLSFCKDANEFERLFLAYYGGLSNLLILSDCENAFTTNIDVAKYITSFDVIQGLYYDKFDKFKCSNVKYYGEV